MNIHLVIGASLLIAFAIIGLQLYLPYAKPQSAMTKGRAPTPGLDAPSGRASFSEAPVFHDCRPDRESPQFVQLDLGSAETPRYSGSGSLTEREGSLLPAGGLQLPLPVENGAKKAQGGDARFKR